MLQAIPKAAVSLYSAADLGGVIAHWIEVGFLTCRELASDMECGWALTRPTSTTMETMV